MNKSNNSSFDLKYLRERAGLTQENMAILLSNRFQRIDSLKKKIHRNSISSWEGGRHLPRLTPKETLQLCDLLNCTLLELSEAIDGSREN